jgi:hypothetical protein
MVTEFIYCTPTWLWGTVFMLLLCGSACAGLLVFDRLVHVDIRRAHNELAGFTVAVISVVYAVLLAFIAIATWESYTTAEEVVQSERITSAASSATRKDCRRRWARMSAMTWSCT